MLTRLHRDERGIALISALLISIVLVSIAVSVVALSLHNSEQSANDRKRLQAVNTAEAGLSATESLLQTTATASLPCTGDAVLHSVLPTTPSRSSASAAIHPDISTMGMPGPGCAAPPARYSPLTSGLRLAGLNAPNSRPWLASP